MRNFLQRKIRQWQHKYSICYPPLLSQKYLQRIFFRTELVRMLETEGDIVECGVAEGEGVIVFGSLAHHENKNRKVFGLDSFQGFPKPSIFDKSDRDPQRGEYSECTIKSVTRTIRNSGVDNVQLIKGFVKETAPEFKGEIALLYIDLDLYDGYKDALFHLVPKVKNGGVVAFDEYRNNRWPGATKAVDEYFGERVKDIKSSRFSNKYYIKI